MRTAAIGMVGVLLLAGSLAAQKTPNFSVRNNEVFIGQITDSLCAEGHHIDVVKSAKNCILTCVKIEGAEFVLHNSGTRHVYKLDDQLQPAAFAGQEVIITGTYDRDSNAIHVATIRPKILNTGL
jgi:hypothetical protein